MIILYSIFLYFFSLYVIKKSIFILSKKSMIDYPSKRSNHINPTPKGIGIILTPLILISTLIILYFENSQNINLFNWVMISFLCCCLGLVSFVDDAKNLTTGVRLFSQFAVVGVSLLLFLSPLWNDLNSLNFAENFKTTFSLTILFFFLIAWIWIINVFNFMDGIDGLTALQVCSFAMCLNILSIFGHIPNEFHILSVILFTVYLAFYKFNKSPSKVFLGDVGSITSGYLIGFIILSCFLTSKIILPLLIINMYYILDSTITLLIRLLKKENIFQAHSKHFYQKVIRKGYPHSHVIKWVFILNLILLILSISSLEYPITSLIFSLLFTGALLYSFNLRKSHER